MNPITCDDCGACCENQCTPFMDPFPDTAGRTGADRLPPAVREDYERGLAVRRAEGFPEDAPCFWLTSDKKCQHYAYRSDICRGLKMGSDDCLRIRLLHSVDE